MPDFSEVSDDIHVIAANFILGAIFLALLMDVNIFNSTLEEHWDEVRRWIGIDRIAGASWGLTNLWNRPAGVVLFVAISALLYAMLRRVLGRLELRLEGPDTFVRALLPGCA